MTGDYNAFSRRSGIIVVGVLRIYNTDSCYLRNSALRRNEKIMSNKCSCTALHHNKKREGVTEMFWHVFCGKVEYDPF